MTLKQSNHRKTSLALGAFLLLFFSTVFFAHPTSAVGTSKVADYKVGNSTGNTNWHSQGATMSKDYYIWTDWKKPNGPTYIVMCSRSNPSNCWRSKSSYDYGHASTLYHRWGTDFFIVKAVKDVKACWSISQKKPVSMSNCNGLISDIKIGTGITYTHNVAQGYTKYGNYYLRSYGNTPGGNYVTLFDKNLKKLKDVKLPNSINEVEDVMVDGNTGIVYFSSVQYINGKKHVQFFKVAENAFSKWLKPGAGGGADSSGERTPSKSAAREKTASDYQKDSYTPSVSTYDGVVNTIFFGTIQDDGEGCGVYTVLDLVMTILTIGIGVTALIGITISGITYLTAKDNVEKTTKAKHRMLQIVIGLVVYAALYAGIQFLLPGGKLDFSYRCATISDEELAQIKAEEAEKRAEEAQRQKSTGGSSSDPGSDSSSGSSTNSSGNSNAAKRNKISEVGVALAWSSTSKPYKKKATAAFNKAMNEIKSNKGESGCRKKGKACGMFVGTVIRYSGVDKNMPTMACRIYDYVRGKGKYKNKGGNKKWQEVKNKKQAQPGDIALKIKNGEGRHVAMYVKNSKGKTVTAEGSLCDYYGVIKSKKQYTTSSNYKVYRYVGG